MTPDEVTIAECKQLGMDATQLRAELMEELWVSHFRSHTSRRERRDPRYDETLVCKPHLHAFSYLYSPRSLLAVNIRAPFFASQVMLTRNEGPGGFVNGDIGQVVAFRQPSKEEVSALEGTPRQLQ
ncbi:MAG: hypothetical protein SGPRY_010937, partial [Prymnesium sp.]